MEITASIRTGGDEHAVTVATDGQTKDVAIPPREGGPGSSLNGGELLFLALATCYANDIFREAARTDLKVRRVDVTVNGLFGGVGEPAQDIRYRVRVEAQATEAEIVALILQTDSVAEIQNTIRQGMPVVLESYEAVFIAG